MKSFPATGLLLLLLWSLPGGGSNLLLVAGELPSLQLAATVQVGGDGVFLPQLCQSEQPLPAIRLCDAPAFGQTLTLDRGQLAALLATAAPALGTNLAGADAIHITRRSRTFGEPDLLGLLTGALQNDYVKDRGQLELHLTQPWNALVLPDEPLSLDILELPTAGVTPGFIVRFALRTAHETLGTWQASLQARVWREVWVGSVQLNRGDPIHLEALSRERRDVLNLRDTIAELGAGDEALEFSESVPAGVPLLARMVRARAVVHRGQHVNALIQDGALSIATKVEILDDGAPGDTVRARNSVTRRDLTGKVLDEKTILISL